MPRGANFTARVGWHRSSAAHARHAMYSWFITRRFGFSSGHGVLFVGIATVILHVNRMHLSGEN